MAEQGNDRAQAAIKSFKRMKELAQGMSAQQAMRHSPKNFPNGQTPITLNGYTKISNE